MFITATERLRFSREDPTVFTISIHQWNNYPADKPPSNLDLNLADGVEDAEYLEILIPAVRRQLEEFRPDMLFYIGGADPFEEDQLGGLRLSKEGLKRRDREVFEAARSRGIPVATALAGGYARKVEDTVTIHVNTIIAAREVAEKLVAQADAPVRRIRSRSRRRGSGWLCWRAARGAQSPPGRR